MANMKVLLVDDEPDILKLMGERIKSWGYDLITASNPSEAVENLNNQNPQIAILDYMMPEMDGVSLLKKIRENNKQIAVIMFTAYPEPKAMAGTEKLGVKAFVPKLSTYSDASNNLKAALDLIVRDSAKGKE
ncbi:MAG: response regulator [Candidatus Omnitrophica bacterium]|nr:response regulator [Candidatus Omnitrophota bacterium]HOX55081.1 response regulator [Candidatus Omnitrophota bacterium]